MGAPPHPWQRALYLPLTILAWLAVLVIGGWLLTHVTKTILLLVLSGVLAFALTPLADLLSRRLPQALWRCEVGRHRAASREPWPSASHTPSGWASSSA